VARLDPLGLQATTPGCDLVPGRAGAAVGAHLRITAPNPGMMTGPGTNSYFVGDPVAGAPWALIDPGPADPVHLAAAAAAARGPVRWVLVTHTHVDHSPGCVAAGAAFGAPVLGRLADALPHGRTPASRPSASPRTASAWCWAPAARCV
jgi:glyoxylase-like metal-dependent hydrolase (beta-lactamase superfamily II)